jgi:ribosomal protein L20
MPRVKRGTNRRDRRRKVLKREGVLLTKRSSIARKQSVDNPYPPTAVGGEKRDSRCGSFA